jgi:predicted RNA-binding Zn-ribbon protein involved in translation (DUF1610 family)
MSERSERNEVNECAVTQTKSCKNCGRTFVPNWRARNFCCPSCREAYYRKRAQLRFRYLRMKTCWRLRQDPEFRSAWMARINKLRAKEGRPPYWNAYENRPYTKDEVVLMQSPVRVAFEPVVHRPCVSEPRTTTPALSPQLRGHNEFRLNEQRTKASEQSFLTLKFMLFGSEQTRQLPVRPDPRCSHQNWRTARVGWQNEPAQICLDCGAIKLVSEGAWRYLPEGTVWVDW